MEVLLKTATTIKPSTKTFDLSNDIDAQTTPIPLAEVQKMPKYSKVTVIVKVLSKGEPAKLDNGKTKQDVIVDSSGVVIVTLWEEKLDVLVVSNNMTKSLSLCRQGSSIEVDDIGTVQENTNNLKLQTSNSISKANIIAVKQLEMLA